MEKIKLSNWYQFPQEFKKLISEQIYNFKNYKSVPFKNDLKFFNSTFVKKISLQLLKDIYYSKLKLDYSDEEIKILKKYCDNHSGDGFVDIFEELWNSKIKNEFNEWKITNGDTLNYLEKMKKDSEDPFFNTKNFKFKKLNNLDEVTKKRIGKNNKAYEIYCNDLLICRWDQRFESYCDVKNGRPTNLRCVTKPYNSIYWNIDNIRILMNNDDIILGAKNSNNVFKNDYPDLNWGYIGPSCPTINEILEKFKLVYKPLQI